MNLDRDVSLKCTGMVQATIDILITLGFSPEEIALATITTGTGLAAAYQGDAQTAKDLRELADIIQEESLKLIIPEGNA